MNSDQIAYKNRAKDALSFYKINAETSDFIRELCVLQKAHGTDKSF